jgi:hypothetical protein
VIDIIKGYVKFVTYTQELPCKEAVNLPLRSEQCLFFEAELSVRLGSYDCWILFFIHFALYT